MTTSSKQNSRFSSLKVFKFAAGPKPPPLPPKDPYYLSNPSLRSLGNSLSPDSLSPSQPQTPLSAQYATLARSPSPTPSYAPSRITVSPYSTTSNFPESASSRKGLFKFSSFGRRPKTPKTADSSYSASSEPLPPPVPVDDPSISLPWNFQRATATRRDARSAAWTLHARLVLKSLSGPPMPPRYARPPHLLSSTDVGPSMLTRWHL
ncbi:hypothetical protein LXA43DRAFT_553632 [Ganoderma leucocontextum]|nr:hypothetical protein LXA43DRAFT_553632 [Ganoderma leucocontextum]